jgi:hypothetical protein
MKRKILRRLDRLERSVGDRGGRGRGDGDRRGDDRRDGCDRRDGGGRGRRGGDFDEKRVIDTIVRLVSERVGDIVREDTPRGGRGVRNDSSRDEGGEKRIVDLIVRLVSERVEEIVEREFEQYLGMDWEGLDDEDGAECGHDHSEDDAPVEGRRPKPPAPADED